MRIRIPSFLVKPSTQNFANEGINTEDYSFYDFLHGLVYARWPYLYIGIGTGEHWIARKYRAINNFINRKQSQTNNQTDVNPSSGSNGRERITFAENYHGKVVTLESASQLVNVKENIELPNLEHIIPYQHACDIVLKNPDHIVALDCPCRVSRADPCTPLDVCLIVGEPFAGYVKEHHPDRSRWISQQEAEEILQEEEERGHVHHAFFKDAMLGRFYAICNCCSCCCGAMQAQRNGTPMLTSSGYVASINEGLCAGCGTCEAHCQFNAISVPNGFAVVEEALCMGCGVCSSHCEQNSISLLRDPNKGEPLEIHTLMEQAAA